MRDIAEPAYPDEDGRADPVVTAALADYHSGACSYQAALARVQDSRVLVPVVAVLGEVEYDENGHARDKTSDMASVLITGRDGRTALLGFTGMETMFAWNPEARPVPVPCRDAAASALHDGADAVVLDIAGPVVFAIEGEDVRSIADGLRLREIGASGEVGWAWTRSM